MQFSLSVYDHGRKNHCPSMRRFLLDSGDASEKYSKDPLGSALMVLLPSVQLTGQTSPYLSLTERVSWTNRDPTVQ